MNKETAFKLKELGFPQPDNRHGVWWHIYDAFPSIGTYSAGSSLAYAPDTDELMLALGDEYELKMIGEEFFVWHGGKFWNRHTSSSALADALIYKYERLLRRT